MTTQQPPSIKHINRPNISSAQRIELAETAARNVRLSGRATKLLLFYAAQANGFRPALKLIQNSTGIRANLISQVRKQLSEHNVIKYSSAAKKICICWDALSAYALMEPLSKAEANNSANFPGWRDASLPKHIKCSKNDDDWLRAYVRFVNRTSSDEYRLTIEKFKIEVHNNIASSDLIKAG